MRKIFTTLFAIMTICIVAMFGAMSASAATSGTTGDCTWTLDGTVLTISGNGNMGTGDGYRTSFATNITKVVIEEGVTNIENYAFKSCQNLTSVTIPSSVTSIGEDAFAMCSNLTSITIPDSVAFIGKDAFYGCKSLTNINITDLAAWCEIDLKDSLLLKAGAKLYLNGNLLSGNIVIPAGVKSIRDSVFYYYTYITSITIPDSVTSIGSYAFIGCTSLTNITIPDSVTSIGSYAFEMCRSLTNITIPDSVTSISEHTFGACTNLASITIPDSVTSIGYGAFIDCTGLTNITIPDSVTSISYFAFHGCKSLASITIPSSITFIGNYAFRGCNFDYIYIKSPVIAASLVSGESHGGLGNNADWIYIDNSITDINAFITSRPCKNTDTVYEGTTYNGYGNHTYDNACDTTCNTCGYTRTITHSYKTTWDKDSTNHWFQCSVCSAKKNEGTHTYGSGKVTKEPTVDAEGVKTYTCTVCYATKTEAIAKLPPATTKNQTTTVVIIVSSVAVIGACGATIAVVLKKKK